MISISTVALSGIDVLRFAEHFKKENCSDTGIELFFDTLPFHTSSYYKKYIAEFIESSRIGMHCPMTDCEILAKKGTLRLQYSLDRHEECFELAAALNSRYMVLHTNSLNPLKPAEKEYKKQLMPERIMLIAEMAKKYHCELWVENVGFHKYNNLVADFEFYINLILENKHVYSLIDTGHANVNGWDIPLLMCRLGDRIRGLHIHDNDSLSDQHLPIFHGNIQWDKVFKSVQNPDACELILEYAPGTSYHDIMKGRNILIKLL